MQIASGDTVVATWTADKSFASLVFSSDAVTSGDSYTVDVGGRVSGTGVGGMTLRGSTAGATTLGTVTAGQAPAGRGH